MAFGLTRPSLLMIFGCPCCVAPGCNGVEAGVRSAERSASPTLENLDEWQTFCVTITPSKQTSFLVMVPAVVSDDPAAAGQGGYVILDNIRPVGSCD